MPTPTESFLALVTGPADRLPLDQAALLLSAHADPQLDVGSQLTRLDEVASQCADPSVDAVVELLFGQLALRGNVADYGDPRNSFLDQVLDRRLGIPISLSVLVIEIGRRVGLHFEGIGMPGHFLVRHIGVPAVLLDPFHRGQRLDQQGVESLFRQVHGPGAPFSPSLLGPSPPLAILTRMLANLRVSYRQRNDASGLVWVSRLLAGMPGVPAADVVDSGRALANLGRFPEAAAIFETLAEREGISDPDADRLRAQAHLLRARLN